MGNPGKMITVRTVKGVPITVGRKEIIPEARVLSGGRVKGVVGARGVGGAGSGFVLIQPVAVVERGPTGTRRLRIYDLTLIVLAAMFLVALLLPILLGFVVRLTQGRGGE
ncbi:MAG: hypothetical protein ACE5NP_02340 [Anaerolineae bacterium]